MRLMIATPMMARRKSEHAAIRRTDL